jgi:hypothetical protein
MNLPFNFITGLLTAGLLAQAEMASAQAAETVPSNIILNGTMTILGDKRAFFKAAFADGAPPVDFMLAEGEGKFGLQLLAVDPQLKKVTVREQGFIRTLAICATPKLIALQTTNGTTINWVIPAANEPAIAASANPGNNTNGVAVNNGVSGGFAKNPASAAGTDTGDSPNNASDPDPAPQTHLYQWWVKEAEKIERARVETASRVMAGEWQPYPLTPLTPPGTPAPLISDGSAFMDHGPGIVLNNR